MCVPADHLSHGNKSKIVHEMRDAGVWRPQTRKTTSKQSIHNGTDARVLRALMNYGTHAALQS